MVGAELTSQVGGLMFDQDDMHTDRLFYLYDLHMEFFDSLDEKMQDGDLREPSPAELALMDEEAERLLQDLLDDENEDTQ